MNLTCKMIGLAAGWLISGLFARAAAPAPVEPSEWIDPATGHVIVRLSQEDSKASTILHQNVYTPDGKKVLVFTPKGMSTVDLQTHEIDLVVPGYGAANINMGNGIEIGRKQPVVYYSKTILGQEVTMAVNLDTHESKHVATLPPGAVLGGITADDAMIIGTKNLSGARSATSGTPTSPLPETPTASSPQTPAYTTPQTPRGSGTPSSPFPQTPRGSGTPRNPTAATPANRGPGTPTSPRGQTPTNLGPGTPTSPMAMTPRGSGTPTSPGLETPMALRPGAPTTPSVAAATGRGAGGRNSAATSGGARGQNKQIYTVSLKTGETKSFFPNDDNFSYDNLTHLMCSPTDPNLILFAHEGNGGSVDRIWTMSADGSNLKAMPARTLPNESASHEFFSHNGKWVYYDLQTPRSAESWIGGANVETGEHIRYPVPRSDSSMRYTMSWDDRLFSGVGDGGATAQDGQWMYLFTPTGESATLDVNGEKVKVGQLTSEKLVELSHQNNPKGGRGLEPNATFTPDNNWLVFRSDMKGVVNVYEVEIAKATPDETGRIDREWAAYRAAGGTTPQPK